jgi:nucleoside 2-deoxyribosyltransferase
MESGVVLDSRNPDVQPTRRPAVFLCGPITNVIDAGAFNTSVRRLIERMAERLEGAGFSVLSAHRAELFGACIPERPLDVFLRDWNFARTSDAMVVILPSDSEGRLIRSDGTFMELGWAVALQKPLFIVTDPAASGRSYLFDGLLDFSSRAQRFDFQEAMEGSEFLLRLRRELSVSSLPMFPASLVALCPSCGIRTADGAP